METVLYQKFTQHEDLKRELLATGDAELIEVWSPSPSFRVPIGPADENFFLELGQRSILGMRSGWEG